MWIVDKILGLFGGGDATYKMPPEEFHISMGKIRDAVAEVKNEHAKTLGNEPVETLYVEYEDGTPLPTQGILKDMGYRVGKNGLLLRDRREILWRTFRLQLDSNSDWYVRQWGPRCSRARLQKMDRVLGGLAANAERIKKNDMSEAIRNWREDQQWLRSKFDEWLDHTH